AGVALLLLAFGCLTSGAAAYGFGFADTLGIQAAVTIAAANAPILGSAVTQSDLKEATVRRQSALLNSVRFASEGLLALGDREETVKAVLQQLATEAGMARVYVLENRPDLGSAQPIYTHWCVGKPDDLKQSELDSALFKRINDNSETLSAGEVLQYSPVDLREQEQHE